MGRMVSVELEDGFLSQVDEVVRRSGRFSSRSEFFKDSLRKNLADEMDFLSRFGQFKKGITALRKKAYSNGYAGSLLSRSEKERIANEWVKENKIKLV